MDKKQLYDVKVFDEAVKIIISKSNVPLDIDSFTQRMIRYNEATEKFDVIGCAKIINELKVYFDGSKIAQKILAFEMMFVKALKILAEVHSYHNGDEKDKHWINAVKILKSINISEDHERFIELKNFFSKKN